MKKKKYTRRTAWLFKDGLKKGPLPLAHFKTEDDLYEALVEWFDYHDPIGLVRDWGIYRENEIEAEHIAQRVQHCRSAEEFAEDLRKFLTHMYDLRDLKPHFIRRGFRMVAEEGWALWRRFDFDMKKDRSWVVSREKLARFNSPDVSKDGIPRVHRLMRADDFDCQYVKWSRRDATLNFIALEVAHLSDAQIIEKARRTDVIDDEAEIRVTRDDPEFITVKFDYVRTRVGHGSYAPGSYPRRKSRVSVIEVD